jgi:hypothetical protein
MKTNNLHVTADTSFGTVPVQFTYNTAFPWAVQVHFPTENIQWVFERSLLFYGLYGPEGEGDVLTDSMDDTFELCLRSPDRRINLFFRYADIELYVRDIYKMVADGDESRHDRVFHKTIDRLLEQAI